MCQNFVGWVERPGLANTRDTHHLHAPMMGIAKALHPAYKAPINRCSNEVEVKPSL
jgi:hypothetical protein